MILPRYSGALQVGASALFFCAIIHIFLTPWLGRLHRLYQHKKMMFPGRWKQYLLLSECFGFLNKIELVFIVWAVPLFVIFVCCEGYRVAMAYFNSRNYVSSLFIMIMLIFLESRPIECLSERIFSNIAKLGYQSPKCWWWTIMLFAPLSTFFLKETGAMIIGATLLAKHFYRFYPSSRFGYATLGLLFSNISIGGLLTAFSSRALFIILPSVKWGNEIVIKHFCWKAVLSMLISTTIYYFVFKKEFHSFPRSVVNKAVVEDDIPYWVILVHIVLVGLLISTNTIPLFMMAILIFYLGFQRFTIFYQHSINISKTCCVGLFYAGLVIFGELQEWWVLELMHRMSDFGYMLTSYGLSIFLDNALVNYLVHNLPVATDCYLYLVITGCMSAGGLTIISNMPNIVGYLIIKPAFQVPSFSMWRLFISAAVPSVLALLVFWFLKDIPEFLYCFFR